MSAPDSPKNAIFPLCTGILLVGAGIAAMRFSKDGATLYGLPTSDKQALGFARAAGARDIALGAMLLSAPSHGRSLLFACTLVSLLDLINVLTTSEELPLGSLSIHASGVLALFLFASLTPKRTKSA